ncbi:MAG: DUF1501 domain-containing protein [Planctomycetaceae bacterium]|nr:DUF1501 domain-containing protein [Planctomycetaceae bacterium]
MDRAPYTDVPITRRRLLQVGGLGSCLGLPALLAAESDSGNRLESRADACIVLFLNGGPSHLDMWDMKPHAAREIRGEFESIDSSLPGVPVCEHLPRLARQMHRATLIRSLQHTVNNSHAAAVYCALTGHDRGEIGGGARPDDNPAVGSVLGKLRPPERPIVPFVHLPYITKEGAGGPPQPGFFGGYLGRGVDPLIVTRDPNAADFAVPELSLSGDVDAGRLRSRSELLSAVADGPDRSTLPVAAASMERFQQRAIELLESPDTQRAFELEDEPGEVRERYGRNIYGQSVLLARRLIEAGTRLVTVSWAPDANATWDTHGDNFGKLKRTLLPEFDAACSSLLQDLADRGRLDRTLVAVLGDFGRTPKINGNSGRDHWNWCYTLSLFGGGFRPGLVYGESDATGAFPNGNPVSPADLITTMYHALGVPAETLLYDALQRPHQLVPRGRVMSEWLT